MMEENTEGGGLRLHLRLGSMEKLIVVQEDRIEQAKGLVRTVLTEPFTKRPWSELLYFCVSAAFAGVGAAFIFATLSAGIFLAVTFVGVIVLACSIRGA